MRADNSYGHIDVLHYNKHDSSHNCDILYVHECSRIVMSQNLTIAHRLLVQLLWDRRMYALYPRDTVTASWEASISHKDGI